MATLNPIQESPNPVPTGTSGTITLTFTTNPGTPDLAYTLTVAQDGATQRTATGTLSGSPAEPTPTVAVGSTGSGWEIRSTAGTLVALGGNRFSIAYS